MRAVPVLLLALASACIMPVRSTGGGGSSGGYGSSGSGGSSASSGSYGSDGSAGYGATPASAGASAPAAPSTVSVTIRSACSRTVSVFYGDKPRFSSGTTSSVSSNSVSSHTFSVGDMMWVLDDRGEGVGSVTISENTRNVEINSSCGGISAR
jgi:hypothetical protein